MIIINMFKLKMGVEEEYTSGVDKFDWVIVTNYDEITKLLIVIEIMAKPLINIDKLWF